MPITKTNTKRYFAFCDEPGCAWEDRVRTFRLQSQQRLNDHMVFGHPERTTVKDPTQELPEQDEIDKLGNYADHLVVFMRAKKTTVPTKFGDREVVKAEVHVFAQGAWRSLGDDVPVFWKTVQHQIMEAAPEEVGGVLTQGTDRNDREWLLKPVPKANKEMVKALKDWTPDLSF